MDTVSRDGEGPLPRQQPVEVLPHAGDKTHTGVEAGNDKDACHRQPHGADGKPQKCRQKAAARLRPQMGRKDQVPRPKKHGEQGKTHKGKVFAGQFLHYFPLSSAPALSGRMQDDPSVTLYAIHVKVRKDE